MAFTSKRIALLWAAAVCVCLTALRFVFPGYLDPLVPYNLDHYIYLGMHAEGYGLERYFLYYPRPVAHVLIDWCGRLGLRGLLMPLYILSWLNAALLVLYLERFTRARISWWCFAFFAALAYSNPEFYSNLKADPFATFALTFLLGMMHAWQSYVETGRRRYLLVFISLLAPFSLTKESYFVSLAVWMAAQAWLEPKRRRAAMGLLALSAALMAFGVFRASQAWLLFHSQPAPTDPYYTNLSPGSLWHGFRKIGKYVAVPAVAAAVAAALAASARADRRIFAAGAVAVLMGAAAVLPNSALPNHWEAQYAFVGAYLFLSPLLFAAHVVPSGRKWRAGVALAACLVCALALMSYRISIREVAGWRRGQEQIARRMLPALERIREQTRPGDSSLVLGATMCYSPFRVAEFTLAEFGPRKRWTVALDDVPEGEKYTTRFAGTHSPALLERYDHVFAFTADGQLATQGHGRTPLQQFK